LTLLQKALNPDFKGFEDVLDEFSQGHKTTKMI